MIVSTENLKIKKIQEDKNMGVFSLEPLPQGFGSTLGNTLRRVLLTSIQGAAVTQIKIAGATHQFTTIPGVKEDVVELTLNFKQLRFKIHSKDPVVATIEKKGKGEVTAADIKVPSDVEVMNKDLHIATLADSKSEFKVELIIEPGVGYSPMEEREKKNVKLGSIVLDALFSPIVNASYEIEPTRFGERADLDKIVLKIETDGSIIPENALKQAAKVLEDYYSVISHGESDEEVKEEKEEETKGVASMNVENISVDELPLQTRTVNALKKHGIDTLRELAEKTDEDLADVKNLGEKSLSEIKELLEKEGLR